MSLMSTLEGLVAAGIDVVVVGGIASRLQGATRVTDDVDVCYDTTASNERALVDLMNKWHAYPRNLGPGRPWKLTLKELRGTGTVRLNTVHGALNLMRAVKGLGTYKDIVTMAEILTLGSGATVPAANREQMIRAKNAAGRPKDLEDVRELEAARELSHGDRRSTKRTENGTTIKGARRTGPSRQAP